MDQAQKGQRLKELHEGTELFIIPNPWDQGSAKLLASLGFSALTTTSAGVAFSLGKPDNAPSREETLANAASIAAATDLPVAGDLVNGFGARPEDAAETIRLAAAAGLVGGSIEDASGDPEHPIYDFALTVERVAAAVDAARALPFPFALVARTENYLNGVTDFDDTLKRLLAFEKAGADVLFAPGVTRLEDIRTICRSVSRPVNTILTAGLTIAELSAAGVRRVSVGGTFARIALSAVQRAAVELRDQGTLAAAQGALSGSVINGIMAG